MKATLLDSLETAVEKRTRRRQRKRKPNMRVHSRGVLKLAQLIGEKAEQK